MPAVSSATRYGMMNAPPPLVYATPGKRQMLPSPTADPIADIRNPNWPENCSRGAAVSLAMNVLSRRLMRRQRNALSPSMPRVSPGGVVWECPIVGDRGFTGRAAVGPQGIEP